MLNTVTVVSYIYQYPKYYLGILFSYTHSNYTLYISYVPSIEYVFTFYVELYYPILYHVKHTVSLLSPLKY